MYCLWMDSRNFTEFSRPLYAKKCIFPLNFIVPGRIYNDALDYINGTKMHADKTSDLIGEEVLLFIHFFYYFIQFFSFLQSMGL